jgi:hypothetical protein
MQFGEKRVGPGERNNFSRNRAMEFGRAHGPPVLSGNRRSRHMTGIAAMIGWWIGVSEEHDD